MLVLVDTLQAVMLHFLHKCVVALIQRVGAVPICCTLDLSNPSRVKFRLADCLLPWGTMPRILFWGCLMFNQMSNANMYRLGSGTYADNLICFCCALHSCDYDRIIEAIPKRSKRLTP